MENVLFVLKCIAIVVVPLVAWGFSTAFLSNWLRKMVDKGRLPNEYALPDVACAIIIFLLFYVVLSALRNLGVI